MKSINYKIRFYFKILKRILLFFFLIIIYYIKYKDEKIKLNLVIPIKSRDFQKIKNNFKFLKKNIEGINNLVLIGDEKVEKLIKDQHPNFQMSLNFINEKELIDVDRVKNLIKNRNKKAIKRSGWYIQQFLKMQYSKVSRDKYYLIWDSDTIPVKKISMFNINGKPYFDVNKRYTISYFITMKKVFPELGKKFIYSFVSEHMLIKTEIMKNLINKINNNKNISGYTWYEKIINCINPKYLRFCGFSEFETYGTFVNEYYRKSYDIRLWKSLRPANKYYNYKNLYDIDIQNLAKKYDAISFENWN